MAWSGKMKLGKLACSICIPVLLCAAAPVGAQSGEPEADILPETIPIFPLADVMLFPNSHQPLHIFEPRYREMVADAVKGKRIIGMVLLRPGFEVTQSAARG
jgi:hypothetical protein